MKYIILYLFLFVICFGKCITQAGPDPWNLNDVDNDINNELDVPPDIKVPLKRTKVIERNNGGIGEWSFKRTLAILMKGGQIRRCEDHSVDVSIKMKFYPEQWDILDGYLKSDTSLTEDMFRRALGYIEESIYKPSIVETFTLTWTGYIQDFFVNYKMHITWSLVVLSAIVFMVWLWNHTSHLKIVILTLLYLYEVFVSYKEVEERELQTFLTAVQTCKWYFWKSSCEVPTPDLLVFLKHMNPMKIGIRMLTILITEPIVTISETLKTIMQGITDGLWYPLDKIVYGILIVSIHVLLIFFFIMVLFNYILNIPINLNIFGLLSIAVRQRSRTIFSKNKNVERSIEENTDRIGGDTLNKILDVCSRALDNASQKRISQNMDNVSHSIPKIKRSASTGRLHNTNSSFESSSYSALEYNVSRKRNVISKHSGGGDAI